MKILLTAYEPFNKSPWNSSLEVLNKIDSDVCKREIKVSFKDGPIMIKQAIDEVNPDIVILMGEYGGNGKVSLEKIAINYQGPGKEALDNYGVYKDGEVITEGGVDGIFTNVDIENLNRHLLAKGFDTRISLSAGNHLCNIGFYVARTYSDKYKCIFIHIPKCEVGSELEQKNIETVKEAIEFIKNSL